MSATDNAWQSLPVELIENIIAATWALPLTSEDRITFMTSSLLVNKTWMVAFMRISSIDVHIPSPQYVWNFFRLICGATLISSIDKRFKSYPSQLIKSITIRIDNDATHPNPSKGFEHPMGKALTDALDSLRIVRCPSLQRLTVEYHNCLFDDIASNWRFIHFPSELTELELKYTFSSHTPPWLIESLRSNHERNTNPVPWSLPSVIRLSILGASPALVEDVVSRSPKVESITTDDYINLDENSLLPLSVKSVLLCSLDGSLKAVTIHGTGDFLHE